MIPAVRPPRRRLRTAMRRLWARLWPSGCPGCRLAPDGGPGPHSGPYPWEDDPDADRSVAQHVRARNGAGWVYRRNAPWCNARTRVIHLCELEPGHATSLGHLCRCGHQWGLAESADGEAITPHPRHEPEAEPGTLTKFDMVAADGTRVGVMRVASGLPPAARNYAEGLCRVYGEQPEPEPLEPPTIIRRARPVEPEAGQLVPGDPGYWEQFECG